MSETIRFMIRPIGCLSKNLSIGAFNMFVNIMPKTSCGPCLAELIRLPRTHCVCNSSQVSGCWCCCCCCCCCCCWCCCLLLLLLLLVLLLLGRRLDPPYATPRRFVQANLDISTLHAC
mmetsp:Transcript_33550/g.109882  ORF Transcript_33550/g.109882 Transcript_33550/m.109882 type:complete len:118 (+) Transcript_33550:1710-2063(+)